MKRKELSKERYLEIKYYCRQYKEKKKMSYQDTAQGRRARADVKLMEYIAGEVDPVLSEYILKQVSTGIPYEQLIGCPCGRRQFYDARNEFLNRLSKIK